MERWAANTLRTLGIVLTAIVVICGGLFLVLLGQCASQGGFEGSRNPQGGMGYYFGAILLALAGITFIAVLGRGIHRSRLGSPEAAASAELTAATAASPTGRRAIDRIFWCVAAQLALVAVECVYNWLQYRQMPQMRYYAPMFVISSILYSVPYAILIGFVRRRFSQIVVAFALGIPVGAILHSFVVMLPLMRVYLANPHNLGMIGLQLILDVVLIILAWQATQLTEFKPAASSILTCVVVAFVYFYTLHLTVPFIYRIVIRR